MTNQNFPPNCSSFRLHEHPQHHFTCLPDISAPLELTCSPHVCTPLRLPVPSPGFVWEHTQSQTGTQYCQIRQGSVWHTHPQFPSCLDLISHCLNLTAFHSAQPLLTSHWFFWLPLQCSSLGTGQFEGGALSDWETAYSLEV